MMFALRCPCASSLLPLFLAALSWPVVVVGRPAELVRRDWEPNQINQTICWWEQPRAALLRDTFYLDGGYMAFTPGFANGTVGGPLRPEDGRAMHEVNFTSAFDTTQNATEILARLEKSSGPGNNLAPEYYDGAILANDHVLYLYGGLLRDTDSQDFPAADGVLSYERFQYGPDREWEPGFIEDKLPEGMTRYVTAGASANVPSENLAFYFSGMRRQDWGDIRTSGRRTYNATDVADTLISVDISSMRHEGWTNTTLPSTVPGRAGAELVWIPTAERGVLVAVGGVVNPEWAWVAPSAARVQENEDESPGFMESVSLYDIESKEWYNQETSGDRPPPLTQFCSVVTSAKDGSSHSIYIYGGYDGVSRTSAPSDDVYVLSVPSFIWIKVYEGTPGHARRSHRCARPYPDQMLVVGGVPDQPNSLECLDGVLQMFNLNSLTWEERYDPETWSEYQVPAVITAKIGGTVDGGATTTEPERWGDSALESLFGAEYPGTVKTYYPYSAVESSETDSPRPSISATPSSGGSGVPSWVAPVLGVILGLLGFILLVGVIVCLRRRRTRKRSSNSSDVSTAGFNRNKVQSWIRNTRVASAKAGTVTSTTEHPSTMSAGTTALDSTGDLVAQPDGAATHGVGAYAPQEVPAEEIYELPEQSSPASELPTAGPTMQQIGFSSLTTTQPSRPRMGQQSSNQSASSSIGAGVGAGIPRAESPTTDFSPRHRRQQSSIVSAGLPSPASTATLGSGDPERERGNPLDDVEIVSPVSQNGNGNGNGHGHGGGGYDRVLH